MKFLTKTFIFILFLALADKNSCSATTTSLWLSRVCCYFSYGAFNITSTSANIRWADCLCYNPFKCFILRYYTTDSTNFTQIKITTHRFDTCSINGLTPNTLYHYKLTVFDSTLRLQSCIYMY